MRHIQASVWLGCLFLFWWTSGENTEEIAYRQHYYDTGDEYDQSGAGGDMNVDSYYSELSNDATYGGNTEMDDWAPTDYPDHTDPSEDYDYTMSGPPEIVITTADKQDGHANSTTQAAYAEETEPQEESTNQIIATATDHTMLEGSSEPVVTGTETTDGYGDEYSQYETEGPITQTAAQTAAQEPSTAIEPSETLGFVDYIEVTEPRKNLTHITELEPGWTEVSTDEEGCSQGQLLCDDGVCINTALICDGKNDCEGGEDEDPDMCKMIDADMSGDVSKRPMILTSNMTFQCGDGKIIELERAYDTIDDCKDGSDESDRGRDEKMSRCFQCEVDGMCLSPKVLCDGIVDCENGADEDELNCEYALGKTGGVITTDEDGGREGKIPVDAIIKNAVESPDLKVESAEEVKRNGVIILTCTYGSEDLDDQLIKKATWYKNEIPLRILKEKDSRYGVTDNVLHISNINDKDLGKFVCVVHLRNGTFVKSELDVTYSKEWMRTSEKVTPTTETIPPSTEFYGETIGMETETGEMTDGVTNGFTNGVTDGFTDEVTGGFTDEFTDEVVGGVVGGVVDEVTDGFTEGITYGFTEGMSEGMAEGMTERMTGQIVEAAAEETTEGAKADEVGEGILGGVPIAETYDEGETSQGVDIDKVGISTDTSEPREMPFTPHYEVVPQEASQTYPAQTTEPYVEAEPPMAEPGDSFIDLQTILRDRQPYMVEEETTPGEILVLQCPLPSVVPFDKVEEMYWMHDGNKIAMSTDRDNHLGMAELRSSAESQGRWDCHVRSGPSDVVLGSNVVHVRDDDREYVPADGITAAPQISAVKTEEISYPEQPLPTEDQLIQWMTTTEAPYSFDLKAEPSYSTLRVGDSVSISCSADNLPPGVAIYFIKTRPYGLALGEVSEYHEGAFANYTLTIGDVKPATSGEYQCIAVTEDRRAVKADFKLAVVDGRVSPPAPTPQYLPTVSLNVGDAMYPENERAELRCSGVLPQDYHRLIWKFNDKEISTDDPAYQIDGSSLFVRKMGPQFAGIYSCSVTDSTSATYKPAFGKLLLQTDKFDQFFDFSREHGHEVYTDIQSTSINQGDALTINCFSRYPALSYTWYQLKDGVEVPLGNEQRLYIPSVHEVGSATYVCRANTAHGQTRETVVSVSVAAKLPEEPVQTITSWIEPTTQTVDAGSTVYFTCRCNMDFRSIIWERISQDGSTVQVGNEPILMLSDVTPAQSGQYSCDVVSDDGSHSRSVAQLIINPVPSQSEHVAYRELKRCGADEATCRDGTCIKRQFICDGKPDCPDGTDEKGCGGGGQDGECHPDQFMCPTTRQCIQKIWLCDGESDCPDGTDEAPRYCEMMAPSLSRACKPSEFQCKNTNFTQCIPRSYVCDESIDCPDQSDEIGCVKPTVTNPPEREKEVNLGETLVLRCTARGTPLPFINWRLNWGFICGDGYDNGRCTLAHEQDSRYPDVVVGILTVRNMQPSDAGAYSCEAINNKGFHFAVPDAFVTVKVTSKPSVCNEIGTASIDDGVCRCKINVIGPMCDQCKPSCYHLSKDSAHGCTRCFCSGVAKTCVAESALFETVYVDFSDFGRTWQVVHEDYPANSWISPDVLFNADERSISISSTSSAPYGQLYWQPSRMGSFPLGNLIRTYGGNLVIKFRRVGGGPLNIQGPLVWLRGNKIDIVNTTTTTLYPEGGIYTIVIRLYENSFTKLDGTQIDRAHMMMTLADVDKFWIWAGQGGSTEEPPTIVSVSLEVATSSGTGSPAYSVEKCSCPPQYTGSSCERCAQGYTKHEGAGLYLGECYPCRQHCHGKTDSCNPETGECYNCGENTAGPRCELCATGFRLDTQTGRCEPEEPGQIEVPAPRIVIGEDEYQPLKRIAILLRPGQRRVIKVVSKDIPLRPSSVWLRVESTGQRVSLPDGMSQVGHDLVIDEPSPHMTGVYEVKLTFDNGKQLTPTIFMEYDYGFTAQQPTLEPQGLVQKALDEEVTITVNLNGFPANKIIWTKDHQQLPPQVIQEAGRITIIRLLPELCGTYEATLLPYTPREPMVLQTTIECTPSGHAIEDVGVEMAYGPPKITLTPSEVNLVEGQTMVVTYEIVGEQPVDLVWRKLVDDALLDMPPSFSILRDRVVLKDSRIEDSGVYRVEATNRFGRDEAVLRLQVRRGTLPKSVGAAEPEVFFERTVYEVMPGERVYILPDIRSTASYQVRWTDGNGDPLPYGVHSENDALVIDSMTENLAGSYVIEVTTDDARVRVPVEIEILGQQHHIQQHHHVQQHEQHYEYHGHQQQYEQQTSVHHGRGHQQYGGQTSHEQGSKVELSLPQQFTVEAGNSFEIKCEASGVDPRQLVFTWKKHGHEGEEPLPSNVQADGQTLRGSNVQLSDYAYYMCQAESPQTGQQAVAYTLLNVQSKKDNGSQRTRRRSRQRRPAAVV